MITYWKNFCNLKYTFIYKVQIKFTLSFLQIVIAYFIVYGKDTSMHI